MSTLYCRGVRMLMVCAPSSQEGMTFKERFFVLREFQLVYSTSLVSFACFVKILPRNYSTVQLGYLTPVHRTMRTECLGSLGRRCISRGVRKFSDDRGGDFMQEMSVWVSTVPPPTRASIGRVASKARRLPCCHG